MTIHINELIEFLAQLCENKNVMVSTTESLKGGVIAGCSAALGGLLLGPLGLAIGAAVGGVSSAIASRGKLKPLSVLLKEMSLAEKKRLGESLVKAFRDFGVDDIHALLMLLLGSTSMKEMALRQLLTYLSNHKNMKFKTTNRNLI